MSRHEAAHAGAIERSRTSPRTVPMRTACVREVAPSLAMMALMWDLTTRDFMILGKVKGAGYYSEATCIDPVSLAVAGEGFSEQGTDRFQGILWIRD